MMLDIAILISDIGTLNMNLVYCTIVHIYLGDFLADGFFVLKKKWGFFHSWEKYPGKLAFFCLTYSGIVARLFLKSIAW